MKADEFFDGLLHLATVKQFLSKEDLVFLVQYVAKPDHASENDKRRAEDLHKRVAAGVMKSFT
jgi:hypothetical protein